jgi:hypothetical protein
MKIEKQCVASNINIAIVTYLKIRQVVKYKQQDMHSAP